MITIIIIMTVMCIKFLYFLVMLAEALGMAILNITLFILKYLLKTIWTKINN